MVNGIFFKRIVARYIGIGRLLLICFKKNTLSEIFYISYITFPGNND